VAALTLDELPGALLALGERAQTALGQYAAKVAQRMAADAATFAQARVGGSLARSVEPLVEFHPDAIRAGFIAGRTEPVIRYARVQDEGSGYLPGGVIRPRFMEYLRIPVPGSRARERFPGGPLTLLHDSEGMKFFRLRARDGWLMVYRGEPLWILVRTVRLRATNYGRDAHDAEVRRIDGEIADGLPALRIPG
jgi:hypothetical protein